MVCKGREKNAAETTSRLKVSSLTQWETTLYGSAQTASSARSRDSTKVRANRKMTSLYRTSWPDVQIHPPVSIKDMPAARQVYCLADVLANSGTKKLRQAVISRDSRDIIFCLPIPSKDACNSWRVLQILVTCIFFRACMQDVRFENPSLTNESTLGKFKPEWQGLRHHNKYQHLTHILSPRHCESWQANVESLSYRQGRKKHVWEQMTTMKILRHGKTKRSKSVLLVFVAYSNKCNNHTCNVYKKNQNIHLTAEDFVCDKHEAALGRWFNSTFFPFFFFLHCGKTFE